MFRHRGRLLLLFLGLSLLAWLVGLAWPGGASPGSKQGSVPGLTSPQGECHGACRSSRGRAAPTLFADRLGPADAGPDQGPRGDDCLPGTGRACWGGDVYSFDSCAGTTRNLGPSKLEECGGALCHDGRCETAETTLCAELSPTGRCHGDVVLGCIGGRTYRRDCAAIGKRCVYTDEGALCRLPSDDDCEHHGELPRCEGGSLLSCVDGRLRRSNCAAAGALCGLLPDGEQPVCHVIQSRDTPPGKNDSCGPCGCDSGPVAANPATSATDGRGGGCDGWDNDQDGLVDEGDERDESDEGDQGDECAPIPIVAFVIASAGGTASYVREDLDSEMARVNAVLASAPEGLRLTAELVDVVHLRRPEWLTLDGVEFDSALSDPALSDSAIAEGALGFFVPILFTDVVENGDTPKLGMATLPNGNCGGRRVSRRPQSMLGGMAVAKGRAPTTVAHELGHYLGLCHTHFKDAGAVTQVARWPVDDQYDALQACQPQCLLEGDGMCDTPLDPGPQSCVYDAQCQTRCAVDAAPDANNVMSYYTECRSGLSPLQAIQLRRGLALRRGFYRCRKPELCPCDPLASVCPTQMTCRPSIGGYACGPDGPVQPSQACAHHRDCGAGGLCASDGQCRLPCHPSQGRCDCRVDSAIGIAVCF